MQDKIVNITVKARKFIIYHFPLLKIQQVIFNRKLFELRKLEDTA